MEQDFYNFYKNKKVFITGHTGFKGSWMCKVLSVLGATIKGYALTPPTAENLFQIANIENEITSDIGDINDLEHLKKSINEFKPEIVIHMAAQPIVLDSYKDPVYTYCTNVMGTVHILEAIRECRSVRSFVNVTTDKVYQNNEWSWGYRESDILNGFDPYSNSKSCSELITDSYKKSFFANSDVAISTCRAGNVIGGGDFAPNRIIPDCVRAAHNGETISVRNPNSIRPYQHVLEPVVCYLQIAKQQYEQLDFASNYNIGPNDDDCISTGKLATLFCDLWHNIEWENTATDNAPHEANFLKLDCSKIKSNLGWAPRWNVKNAIEQTVSWSKAYFAGEDMNKFMEKQINIYLGNEME